MDKFSRTCNGVLTYYVYDGNVVIEEQNEDNEEFVRNVYGRNLITREQGYTKAVYGYNGHGDVVYYTNTLGHIIRNYNYDEFGNVLDNVSISARAPTSVIIPDYPEGYAPIYNPYRYAGYEYLDEVALYDLNARYYNPEIARFLSADPYYNLGNRVIGLYEINVPNAWSIVQANNIYVYCGNNPFVCIDPLGLDAIVITNENSVPLGPLGTQGHTSAIYQNADGDWFYTYWGNKAAAVICIPDTYIKEWRRNGDLIADSMSSLSDFNNALNTVLSAYRLENITSNYTNATYIVGDFTKSLETAYSDVSSAYTNKYSEGTLKTLDNGSKIFQGHNSPYNVGYNNCLDRTYASLSMGTLVDGTNVGKYMQDLGFEGGLIPNNALHKFSEVFMNNSFVYGGAYSALSNYAVLYEQDSPWAQKSSKAAYANMVIGK